MTKFSNTGVSICASNPCVFLFLKSWVSMMSVREDVPNMVISEEGQSHENAPLQYKLIRIILNCDSREANLAAE